ncbi:MCE family protein [Nocardioides sp. YIM 152588]|uniref:MCE family protein n=1 Tax=Nocardioides sp. YIM 152588 TaxID=3158259 RepID=UPI0032E3A098
MLVNVHHDSAREHNRLLLAGIVFLTVIALLIGLSIAIYNKTFDRVTWVTVQADRAGLQLAKYGDVRVDGVLVGQVREISQDGQQAVIRLALDPEAAATIPSNVSVEILPTTLFGQKFVSLVRPARPSATPISDGEVIPASRVETNVELSQVLAQLFPLLRAVRPADLNATLNAIATALSGRGEQIGRTMEQLGGYLTAIDDHLPTLRQDLVELAEVADIYDLAAPDLIDTLANVTVTSKTIVQKRRDLDTFFSDISGVAGVANRVLADNEQNLVRMGQMTEPVLAVLETYSPEFSCLIKGAARYEPILSKTFEGNVVKQYMFLGTPQYRHFDERDTPVNGEAGHGPWCLGLPDFSSPATRIPLDQGSPMDENPPTSWVPVQLQDEFGVESGDIGGVSSGFAGTERDKQLVNVLLAEQSGREPASYGAFGSLLYGPVVREGKPAREEVAR